MTHSLQHSNSIGEGFFNMIAAFNQDTATGYKQRPQISAFDDWSDVYGVAEFARERCTAIVHARQW